ARGASGKACADCHEGGAGRALRGAATRYPKFVEAYGRMMSVEEFLEVHGPETTGLPLAAESADNLNMTMLVKRASNGLPVSVDVASAEARAALARGKATFHRRVGERNHSCADCHTPEAAAEKFLGGRLLAFEPLGNVTLLHITDAHATLRPMFYREPDSVVGVGSERGRPPFLTGAELLRAYRVAPGSVEAYAYTYLDFSALAARYGRMGGYAHLATLVKQIRAERSGRTLLLDGGDTLQGSATTLWSRGEDMVRVSNQLGVD